MAVLTDTNIFLRLLRGSRHNIPESGRDVGWQERAFGLYGDISIIDPRTSAGVRWGRQDGPGETRSVWLRFPSFRGNYRLSANLLRALGSIREGQLRGCAAKIDGRDVIHPVASSGYFEFCPDKFRIGRLDYPVGFDPAMIGVTNQSSRRPVHFHAVIAGLELCTGHFSVFWNRDMVSLRGGDRQPNPGK